MKSHFVSLPELPPEEAERLSELKSRLKYKILDINVKTGDTINYNQILASYGVYFIRTAKEVRVWSDKIKSTKNGTIKRISIKKECKVRPGQSIMVIEYCPHEMEYDGLCAFCGADISIKSKQVCGSDISIKQPTIIHGHEIGGKRKIINLTSSALLKIRKENTSTLLKTHKLALVLDIDHTFLHATRDPQAKLVYKHHAFRDSTHSFILPGHRSPYYIKIRPGFRDFLLDVAGAYDIHLYTMSMRKYAEEIVKWIEFDPKYKGLIQNLVTRDDVPSNKKLLHRLFPCDERMVIIIDDRIDVWPQAGSNVIQIHKYLFWPNTEEEMAMNNKSLSMRELGNTQIILEKKIKSKNKLFIEKGLKRFISSFFKELGCYKIEISSDIIYIFTHKSPDDNKLNRFSLAIKEALDLELQQQQQSNSYIYVLQNCKIKYKINSNELKRREGDRVLSCLSSVLLKIHKNYYTKVKENNEKKQEDSEETKEQKKVKKIDARNILRMVKKDVFGGYVFVFSGVFPIDINPCNTLEWKFAYEFGATCVKTLSIDNKEGVTHCIAPRMGTNKTNIALKLGLEIVHPNWLHNSCTHYMKSNPSIYRPQGYDKSMNKSNSNGNLKSILIGNKRKRIVNGINGSDGGPKNKKAKTVKFKGIDDVSNNLNGNNSNPQEKLMDSLNELVSDFNKNKELLGSKNEKDIIIDEKPKQNNININVNNSNNNIERREEEEEELELEDDDNFDFESIHNDIDNAIKHIEYNENKNENNNNKQLHEIEIIKGNNNGNNMIEINGKEEQEQEQENEIEIEEELELEEDEEDEDNDLENMLNEELESLSS